MVVILTRSSLGGYVQAGKIFIKVTPFASAQMHRRTAAAHAEALRSGTLQTQILQCYICEEDRQRQEIRHADQPRRNIRPV